MNRLKLNKKIVISGYFWGLLLGTIFVAFNVLAIPIIYNHAESQIRNIDFSKLVVQKLNGETLTLQELTDSNKMLVNFWATWCRPCRTELPVMEDAYERVKADYVFVMISDEDVATTKKYITQNDYSFEFVKMDRAVFMENGIMERPTTVLLDANFNIIEVKIGEIEQKSGVEFTEYLEKHID